MLAHVHKTTPCHIPGDHTLIDTALKYSCIISTFQSTVVTIHTTSTNTEKLCILTKHNYMLQIILRANIISLHHTDYEVFVLGTDCVFCEVNIEHTVYMYILLRLISCLNGLTQSTHTETKFLTVVWNYP